MVHCWAGHSIRLPSFFSTHGHLRWAAALPQQEVVWCTWCRLLAHCAQLSHTQPHTLMCLHRHAKQGAIAMFVCYCQHTNDGTTPSITSAHAECTRRCAHKGAAHAALSCASQCSRSSAAGSTSSTATCTRSSTSPPLALAVGPHPHSRFRLWNLSTARSSPVLLHAHERLGRASKRNSKVSCSCAGVSLPKLH